MVFLDFKMSKCLLLLYFICAGQLASAQHNPIVFDTLDNWLTVRTPINLVIEKLGEPDSVGEVENELRRINLANCLET